VDEAPAARAATAGGARRPSRRWSRALVGATVAATAVVAVLQLLATFFFNAPSSVVSKRYTAQISWWMSPLLDQNWQLFAPNPISENLQVEARASVGPSGTLTDWVDLSAIDQASTTGNPAPSHQTMNGLRNAWREYAETHTASGQPSSPVADVSRQYLENLVLSYLRPLEPGAIGSVQVRFVVTLIPGPGRTAAQTAPQTQTLPWWVVAS